MPPETRSPPVRGTAVDERLDRAPCGFLSFGEDGSVEWVNRTLLEMLGYRFDEVVGHPVERIMTIGARIFYQTHWFPLLRMQGGAEEIFLILRTASGEDVGMLVNAVRRPVAGGGVFDCTLMRVRERQQFETELLRAKRVAEAARAEVEAQAAELRRANDHLEAQAVELELQQHQLEEQAVELEAVGDELRALNGALLARSREAEHLREVAEEANRAKSSFLAVMSHELRTPLNAIAGYVQLMEMGIHGPVSEAQRETLARIARSQRHLLRLVNDVLNLARIEAGHVEYHVEVVPVSALVGEVLPMTEPLFEQRQVTTTVELAGDPYVRVDLEKGRQILLNLLSNAVKFTSPGGHVAVEAVLTAGHLELRVRDDGIGIPPEKREEIFHPFVQVDVSSTRAAEGSGLGLAISRDLARGMGADITVQSTAGVGSTFALHLPLA